MIDSEIAANDGVSVEVAYASARQQWLIELRLCAGSTVADALNAAASQIDELPADTAGRVGIWGRIVETGTVLGDGDRVEVYRPLRIDPKEARRRRAEPA